MLLKAETEIGPDETAPELAHRLSIMGAHLLVETLDRIHEIQPEPQDNAQATHAPLLKKEDGLIDWSVSALRVHNRARGLQPWPGAYTTFRGHTLHLWKTRPQLRGTAHPGPGRFLTLKPPVVCCGEGALELIEVQLEGRKRIAGADFVNGQRLSDNELLGDLIS
jgi:methionyl-tRNA formyltransferase